MTDDTQQNLDELAQAYQSIEPPPELLHRICEQVQQEEQQTSSLPVWGAVATAVVCVALAMLFTFDLHRPVDKPRLAVEPNIIGPNTIEPNIIEPSISSGDLQIPALSSLTTSVAPTTESKTRAQLPSLGDLSGISLTPISPTAKPPQQPAPENSNRSSDISTDIFEFLEEHNHDNTV